MEVRSVAGMQGCFAALPLHLIQTLQATYSGFLPPLLALELQPHDPTAAEASSWFIAWIGAASNSNAIEVAEKLAECIGLPNITQVHVRARADLPKATTVMLEPATEDDWEILELNADFAEEHLLNQVGIVQEGLRFPLWLHGHTVIIFCVASTEPEQLVVQLVPGTELVVAPKQRKRDLSSNITEAVKSHDKSVTTKALLRVQELDRNLVQSCESGSIRFGVVPTSMAFISPRTGERFSLLNGQLAFLTSISAGNKSIQNHGRKKGQSYVPENANGISIDNNNGDIRQAICRLVFLETVARGHVMLARSLRHYIHANLHTRVVVKECTWPITKPPALLLSPVYFRPFQNNKSHKENDSDAVDRKENPIESENTNKEFDSSIKGGENIDWIKHKDILDAFISIPSPEEEKQNVSNTSQSTDLLQAWIMRETSLMTKFLPGKDLGSFVVGNETVLHFELFPDLGREGQKNGQLVANQSPGNGKATDEIVFLLSVTDVNESSQSGKVHVGQPDRKSLAKYNQLYAIRESLLSVNSENDSTKRTEVNLGQPLRIVYEKEIYLKGSSGSSLSSLSWMETAASEALNRLTLLLSPNSDRIFSNLCLPLPGHVLLHGPPASGKTQLALALAQHLEEDRHVLAHVVFVRCSELSGEQADAVREVLSSSMSEALDHAPSIIVLDDLDSVISFSAGSEGSESSGSAIGLAEYLADLMDACQDRGKIACGLGLVAFLAVVQSPGALPGCLCSSGRFDFHVQVPAPAAAERAAILNHEILKRGLKCSDHVTSDAASKCDGYDTSDLEVLVDRAIHAAAVRSLSLQNSEQSISTENCKKPELFGEDFSKALENFLPAAMRGIAKSSSQGGRLGWEDVGGLFETRTAIKEMLELPIKFSKIFAEAPLRLRSGILLYGPPGCGKTHIVGAAAAACSLRFISVKGPELLNKYIGASEQAVRDIFSKASAAAPCILFFDEFDSIAPKRGHDNTGVTDRVVNQLLTELDGVEALTGVFVFAATSRPDLLDAALLRPGRLDRLLFCDFPSARERLEILDVLSRKLPLASDVDLGSIASITEGFSGADLQALLSDAQLESVHEFLESGTSGAYGTSAAHPLITHRILESVVVKARPSVPESEKHRLYTIYNEFLNSKTSVAAKTRDAKGKRSTLA